MSGDCFVVWQQGMHEDMDVILREMEEGWAMASTNCDVVMSSALANGVRSDNEVS